MKQIRTRMFSNQGGLKFHCFKNHLDSCFEHASITPDIADIEEMVIIHLSTWWMNECMEQELWIASILEDSTLWVQTK